MRRPPSERGFAYIAAIVFLVVMAAMAAAVVRLNVTQLNNTSAEIQGMNATQAARGGVEWGLFQIRANPCRDATASQVLPLVTLEDFLPDTGFRVSVRISCAPFNEGEIPDGAGFKPFRKIIYDIDAVACNGSGDCPADAMAIVQDSYVEHRSSASACMTSQADQLDCYGNE